MTATEKDRSASAAGKLRKKSLRRTFHRFTDPVVGWVIKSPLHGLLSGGIVLVTVEGRKSGKQYVVPVNYVGDEDTLICFTGKSWSGWWKNVSEEGTPVVVTLRGKELAATAKRVREPEIVERGLRAFLTRFPINAKQFGVGLDANRRPNAGD